MKSWEKRITADMLSDYLARGWKVLRHEGRFIVLEWTQEGAPG